MLSWGSLAFHPSTQDAHVQKHAQTYRDTKRHTVINLIICWQDPKLNWAKIKPLRALVKGRSSPFHLNPWISFENLNFATSAALIPVSFLIKIKHVLKALHHSFCIMTCYISYTLTWEKVNEQTNCLSIFNYTNWRTGLSHYNNLEAYHKQTMPWSLKKKLCKNKQMASIISSVCVMSLFTVSTTF